METFLKINTLVLVFYLIYHFILEPLKLLNWNRLYLIASLFLSISLPFCFYTTYQEVRLESSSFVSNTTIVQSTNFVKSSINTLDYLEVFIDIYLIISVVFLIKLFIGLFKIFHLYQKGSFTNIIDTQVIVSEKIDQPFSFIKIFYPENFQKSDDYILKHEKAHCKQLHFIDTILVNIFCVVFWINPTAWLFRKKIMLNLEYLADNEVIKETNSKKNYQISLVNFSNYFETNKIPFTNAYNESLILKRIKMMNTNPKTRKYWKFLLIIPILIAFFLVFQEQVITKPVINKNNEDTYYLESFSFNKNTPSNEIDNNFKILMKRCGFKNPVNEIIFDTEKDEMIKMKITYKDKNGINKSTVTENKNGIESVNIEARRRNKNDDFELFLTHKSVDIEKKKITNKKENLRIESVKISTEMKELSIEINKMSPKINSIGKLIGTKSKEILVLNQQIQTQQKYLQKHPNKQQQIDKTIENISKQLDQKHNEIDNLHNQMSIIHNKMDEIHNKLDKKSVELDKKLKQLEKTII